MSVGSPGKVTVVVVPEAIVDGVEPGALDDEGGAVGAVGGAMAAVVVVAIVLVVDPDGVVVVVETDGGVVVVVVGVGSGGIGPMSTMQCAATTVSPSGFQFSPGKLPPP